MKNHFMCRIVEYYNTFTIDNYKVLCYNIK